MNGWNLKLFMDELKRAVLRLHHDKSSKIECYTTCEGKDYKVIIEEVE